MRKKNDGDKQLRVCLKCLKKFKSAGPANRICGKCSIANQSVSRTAQQSKVYDDRD